jgi:hypothetical protein
MGSEKGKVEERDDCTRHDGNTFVTGGPILLLFLFFWEAVELLQSLEKKSRFFWVSVSEVPQSRFSRFFIIGIRREK